MRALQMDLLTYLSSGGRSPKDVWANVRGNFSTPKSLHPSIGAATVGTGGDWLGWGGNIVLVPQLLGRNFQKAINFIGREPTNKHSSHQNAGFSI